MPKDLLYHKFYTRWEEVTLLPSQTVGPFTPLYKRAVPFLKNAPWRILIPFALVLVTAVILLLEVTAVQITSLLQQAF